MSQTHRDNGHYKKLQEYANQLKASDTSSKFSGGTANVLSLERAKATFVVEEMTNFLDGGTKQTARRRFIISPHSGKDFKNRSSMSRTEMFADGIKDFIQTHKKFPKFVPEAADYQYMGSSISPGGSSLANHMFIFQATISGQGDEEQVKWWQEKAIKFEIIGAYAQTELGHGSNVRGLQTTATYDKSTQEFILDTPTLQSIKWWPGALGKASTHACVYAQLLIDGKEYGVHVFMLQIRDENFDPLPGILLGDLGNKIGDACNDTGFMVLEKVRIPRRYMLMKNNEVSPEGKYIKKQINDQAHYQTMMLTRVYMAASSGSKLALATTVATRWSAIRTQGFQSFDSGVSYKSKENKIIDYRIQQYRIVKQISICYGIKIFGKELMQIALQMGINGTISELKEFAALAAGMKSVCTKIAVDGIEDLRKATGGIGYLLQSGIGQLMSDYLWQITAEGDYVILSLLMSKFLIKGVASVVQGKILRGQLEYLNILSEKDFSIEKASPKSAQHFKHYTNDLQYLLSWFRYKALVYVTRAAQDFQQSMMSGEKTLEQSFNDSSLDFYDSSFAHCWYFIMNCYVKGIQKVENAQVKMVLTRLCAIFACSNFLDDKWADILPTDQINHIRAAVLHLQEELRPDLVPLVDAFDFSDTTINSSIGAKDGNPYESMFKLAIESPLNKIDPFPGQETILQPLLNKEFLKLRNTLPKSTQNSKL